MMLSIFSFKSFSTIMYDARIGARPECDGLIIGLTSTMSVSSIAFSRLNGKTTNFLPYIDITAQRFSGSALTSGI